MIDYIRGSCYIVNALWCAMPGCMLADWIRSWVYKRPFFTAVATSELRQQTAGRVLKEV